MSANGVTLERLLSPRPSHCHLRRVSVIPTFRTTSAQQRFHGQVAVPVSRCTSRRPSRSSRGRLASSRSSIRSATGLLSNNVNVDTGAFVNAMSERHRRHCFVGSAHRKPQMRLTDCRQQCRPGRPVARADPRRPGRLRARGNVLTERFGGNVECANQNERTIADNRTNAPTLRTPSLRISRKPSN